MFGHNVTPYAGVWIEIGDGDTTNTVNTVTPYAGVWIEIETIATKNNQTESLPTRECGLKLELVWKE